MNQLTGNQLAVVLQAERSMFLASGKPQPAEPAAPVQLTEQQKADLIVQQLRAEVTPLRFGGR